jgi:Delta3-Delta2-enoyl-CoA isomerase
VAISLGREGDVSVIQWSDGENRIHRDSLATLHQLLDEVEARQGPRALVLTGEGKFFSNGLDLERVGDDMEELMANIGLLKVLIGRLLVFPMWTVAAINGHCFAGGALLSTAFDERVMRADRGFWCMSEAAIGLRVDDDLWGILAHRLPKATVAKAVITSHRFGGVEAQQWGIVESTAPELEVLSRALELAQGQSGLQTEMVKFHKRKAHGAQAALLGFSD